MGAFYFLPMSVVLRVKEELQQGELQQTDGVPDVEAAWQIDAEDLEYGEKLGSGEYGEVFAGSYFGTDVAIKRLNVAKMGEANAAKYIKREIECSKYSHPNIWIHWHRRRYRKWPDLPCDRKITVLSARRFETTQRIQHSELGATTFFCQRCRQSSCLSARQTNYPPRCEISQLSN